MRRRGKWKMSPEQEMAAVNQHWFEQSVPELQHRAMVIGELIALTKKLMKLSPVHRKAGVLGLLKLWEQQRQDLELYASASEGKTAELAQRALKEREAAMSVLGPKAIKWLEKGRPDAA
jgi:hypothetical protein